MNLAPLLDGLAAVRGGSEPCVWGGDGGEECTMLLIASETIKLIVMYTVQVNYISISLIVSDCLLCI